MKRFLSFLLACALLFSLVACGANEPRDKVGGIRTESGDVYPDALLTFDGETVSFAEFRYFYLNYRDMYLQEDPDYFENEENEKALKQTVLECLLDNHAVRFLAKESKVSLDREEKEAVAAQLEQSRLAFESEEAFLEDLHKAYTSLDYCEEMLEWSALNNKLFETLFKDGGKEAYTDEEFYDYYKKNYIAVQQLYLPFESGESKDSCDGTKKIAADLKAKAAAGEDFWKLVQTHGKDENMPDYPDGYYFTEGEAEAVLYEASRALKVGEISEPVVGETGVYLIRRMELKQLRMDENRETALFGYYDTLNQWHAGAYDRAFQKLYSERAEKIKVEYGEDWEYVSTKNVF